MGDWEEVRDYISVITDLPGPGPDNRPDESESARSGERDLVAAVLRRDRKAAAEFVAAHIDAVYAYVRRRLSPRVDLVDDVVQEVFLAALNGLTAFSGAAPLRAWLLGIARHKVDDLYRGRVREPAPLEGPDGDGSEPMAIADPPIDEVMHSGRLRAKTREILRSLPERYALVLVWRYWQRRTTRHIAAAIDTSEKSVERTLARARQRFKDLWLKGVDR